MIAESGPHERMSISDLLRTINLRDLGGCRAQDGREVRRGILYRSANLWSLPSAQLAAIRLLEIKSIIDLRHNSERSDHPTPWKELGCPRYWFHDHQPPDNNLNNLAGNKDLSAAAARDLMIRAYRELPYRLVEGIRRLIETAAAGEGALLFHCTAGKDRTGIAAALVLAVLGVPEDAILADYLATLKFDILVSPAFKQSEPLSADRLEALRPMITVDSEYLKSMFDFIADRDGSIEGFLKTKIGIGQNTLNAIRGRLLA